MRMNTNVAIARIVWICIILAIVLIVVGLARANGGELDSNVYVVPKPECINNFSLDAKPYHAYGLIYCAGCGFNHLYRPTIKKDCINDPVPKKENCYWEIKKMRPEDAKKFLIKNIEWEPFGAEYFNHIWLKRKVCE
jgi:hypothetical protein